MPSLTTPVPLFSLQLPAAERSWQQLQRGAEIVVTEGAVCLHRREYLAGMWVAAPLLLQAGEQHQVAATGWVEIEAVAAARLQVREPARRRFPFSLAQRLSLIF